MQSGFGKGLLAQNQWGTTAVDYRFRMTSIVPAESRVRWCGTHPRPALQQSSGLKCMYPLV